MTRLTGAGGRPLQRHEISINAGDARRRTSVKSRFAVTKLNCIRQCGGGEGGAGVSGKG